MSDPDWITEFLKDIAQRQFERDVRKLSQVIYPTMWGYGDGSGPSKYMANTARNWARTGLRALNWSGEADE